MPHHICNAHNLLMSDLSDSLSLLSNGNNLQIYCGCVFFASGNFDIVKSLKDNSGQCFSSIKMMSPLFTT